MRAVALFHAIEHEKNENEIHIKLHSTILHLVLTAYDAYGLFANSIECNLDGNEWMHR